MWAKILRIGDFSNISIIYTLYRIILLSQKLEKKEYHQNKPRDNFPSASGRMMEKWNKWRIIRDWKSKATTFFKSNSKFATNPANNIVNLEIK